MAYTQVQQIRSAVYVNDDEGNLVPKFKIDVEVVDKGDLPSPRIFVIQVLDPDTPKSDVFARVARIADFEAIVTDRVVAINDAEDDEDVLFRNSIFTFYYDNLDTANNAQEVLKSRIDELAEDWKTYDQEFVATSEVTDHPRATTDAFNSLVASYSSAATAEETAKDTMDSAKDDYDEAVSDAADAGTAVTEAETAYNDCVEAKGWFDALYNAFAGAGFVSKSSVFASAIGTFLGQATTFLGYCTGDPPTTAQKDSFTIQIGTATTQKTTFEAQDIAIATAALATAFSNQGQFAAKCAAKQNAWTDAKTAKETADTTVQTKRTAYESAKTAYEAAQQATEAALAAVRALKPDWDPATDL